MNSSDAEHIKRQLINNIESSFHGEKADILKKQIMSMNDEQLENFLQKSSQSNECIFCSIAAGKRERFEVGESSSAIAVLEINPVSAGHVLIIPKEHISIDSFTPEIKKFAGEVAQNMKEKLHLKDIEISSQDLGGHGIINLVPVYTNESINSERHGSTKEALKEIADVLNKKEIKEVIPEKKLRHKKEKIYSMPKRIP